jgi:radical SAM protein with 4Fe4S-binding SPASM domain
MVEAGYDGIPIIGNTMRDFWQNGEPFKRIRKKLGSGGCSGCQSANQCLGGCPLFPEINLCPDQQIIPQQPNISEIVLFENLT